LASDSEKLKQLDEISHFFLSSQEKPKGNAKVNPRQKKVDTAEFLDFFELSENPFSDSINLKYFLNTEQHSHVFQKLKLSVEQNISLGLLSGTSGTGKTLITQLLLTSLNPDKYQTILVLVTPGMTKTALVQDILLELGHGEKVKESNNVFNLLRALHEEVIALYQKGKRLVILIDEAHFLDSGSLHSLRTISNIEVPEMKLTTCLLFAEDFFMRRLQHESYASIRNRMYVKEHLEPLNLFQLKKYIQFRLSQAGAKTIPFKDETYQVIHTATGGIPREINNFVFNAMLEAYLQKEKIITNQILLKLL
jgi:type II secretory pathway predicted ATPase ExeA